MRKYIDVLFYIVIVTFALVSCQNNESQLVSFKIHNNWEFKSVDDSVWLTAEVPGSVHTDLMSNGIIDDPFYRLNELNVQWIDKLDWEYRTTFNIDEETYAKDVIELNFKGLDTYATVYLNDNIVLEADNMFVSWRIPCKQHLNQGTNNLRVVFRSPITTGLEKRELLGYNLPGAENDQSERGGLGDKKVCVFSRKPGYHFGWDWGPRLVTSGIWQDVEIAAWNTANIIDVNIIQEQITTKKADLTIEVEIDALADNNISLVTLIDNEVGDAREFSLTKGKNKFSFPLEILYPELWWTNGLGDQRLYDFEIQIKDDFRMISKYPVTIGLRTLELIQKPDSVGSSFYFKLNGHPVFMKGANYIPQDVFLNRVSDEDYINTIKSAVDANYNMLRVWGGGIYEKDIFYDLCDEVGILVWQDFMFACAMYPGNKEFLENVEKEAIQNVRRLRNHPCIALWCGDNEILSAWNRWGWKENVQKNQGDAIVDTIWQAYDTVFHDLLPNIVNKYDPSRSYWSSSPSSGIGKLENGKSGDNHYWGVWWAKEPFEKYEEEIPRFMSEFGFQSFPEFNSVRKYTIEEDWDINSAVMRSHQRSSIGNVTIEEYLLRDYKKPKNFEMFLYVGQLLQARGINIGIEAHRRHMPYCMGSLYWQLNDCWPVASWSGIDYYGNWKALHYAVRDAFKQIIISSQLVDNIFSVYVISDELENTPGFLKVKLMDFDGNIIDSNSVKVVIDSNSSKIYFEKDIETIKDNFNLNELLILSGFESSDSILTDQDIFYFGKPKDLVLPQPNVDLKINRVEDGVYSLIVSTDVLAKNIYLQNPKYEGHFSDNYFDLLPNSSKKIIFYTTGLHDESFRTEDFIITTLADSYEIKAY